MGSFFLVKGNLGVDDFVYAVEMDSERTKKEVSAGCSTLLSLVCYCLLCSSLLIFFLHFSGTVINVER